MTNLFPSTLTLSSSSLSSLGSLQEQEQHAQDELNASAAQLDGLCAVVRAPDGTTDLVVTSTAAAAPWSWTLRCTDLHTVWALALDAAAATGAGAARVAAAFRHGRVAVTAADPAEAVVALPGTARYRLRAVSAPGAVHALVADLARRAAEAAVLRAQRDAARRELGAAQRTLAQGDAAPAVSHVGVCVGTARRAGTVLGRARVHPGGVKRTRPGGARIVADAGGDDSDDVDGQL